MKILPTLLIALYMLTATVVAQVASADTTKEGLQKNNAEVVRLFQQKDYDKALPLAKNSVEIAKALFGNGHIETAHALRNVGYLLYLKGDQDKAKDKLEEAFGIYKKLQDLSREDGVLVANMLELIASIRYKKGLEDAEKSYKLALAWRQKYNGKDSAETLTALLSLANISYWGLKFDDSAELFLAALKIAAKSPGLSETDRQLVFSRCDCVFRKAGKSTEFEAIRESYGPDANIGILVKKGNAQESGKKTPQENRDEPQKVITGGVVNGKATSLPAPNYPAQAKMAGAGGTVSVQVLIDETGTVISACTVNDANPYLAIASETAAYQAKFLPTRLEGKPVKVAGVITYVFNR